MPTRRSPGPPGPSHGSQQSLSPGPHPRSADATADPRPERWAIAAGDATQATLRIPADATRERHFEIACAMTVRAPVDESTPAWHQMTVHADGQQQWNRRVPTHNPGSFDGLDVRFRRSVPPGRELRVTVAVACTGGRRRSLDIEADEM